jgi:hypothetical protein
MKTITIDDVLGSGYCERYTPEIIRRLWGDRETATALDVLDSHLPVEDRVWLVLNTDLLNDDALYTFRATLAHYGAYVYDKYYPDDTRVRDCAEAWQRLAAGETVDIEPFKSSAWDARSAAWDACESEWDYSMDAVWDAAGGAAGDSAWDAAWASAWACSGAVAIYEIARWLRDIVEVTE